MPAPDTELSTAHRWDSELGLVLLRADGGRVDDDHEDALREVHVLATGEAPQAALRDDLVEESAHAEIVGDASVEEVDVGLRFAV